MTRNEILQAFDRMRVWQRGDQRAVHKPLLVLFALARVGAGGTAILLSDAFLMRCRSLASGQRFLSRSSTRPIN